MGHGFLGRGRSGGAGGCGTQAGAGRIEQREPALKRVGQLRIYRRRRPLLLPQIEVATDQ
jgi:hypothetical protein